MLTKQTDIATLISSRICHDMINPIGAISNGLELLALTGMPFSPEWALIRDSVDAASAKLRFLRIAFGDAESGSMISATEIADILAGYYNTPQNKLNWAINAAVERLDLRLLFLLLLCTEKMAPYGGHTVVEKADTGFIINVTVKDLKTDGFLDFHAHRFQPQNTPPMIQFNLAQIQIDQMRRIMTLAQTATQLSITIAV